MFIHLSACRPLEPTDTKYREETKLFSQRVYHPGHLQATASKNTGKRLGGSVKPDDILRAAGIELGTLENLTSTCKNACVLAPEDLLNPQLLVLAPKQ